MNLSTDIDGLKPSPEAVEVVKSDAHKIEDLQRQLAEKDILLEHLIGRMEQMKMSFHRLLERSDDKNTVSDAAAASSNSEIVQTCVSDLPMNEDESYFNTYAHFDIHHDMLSVCSFISFVFHTRQLITLIVFDIPGCGSDEQLSWRNPQQ